MKGAHMDDKQNQVQRQIQAKKERLEQVRKAYREEQTKLEAAIAKQMAMLDFRKKRRI